MNTRFLSALIVYALLTCALFVSDMVGQNADTEDYQLDLEKTLTVGSLERSYLLHLPSGHKKTETLPLVFVLHGGGGEAGEIRHLTRFNTLADKEKFIVVYPKGIEKHWNDGRGGEDTTWKAHDDNIDDIGFLAALLDEMKTNYKIDTKRVYATGISNGGLMSYRIALELSDDFAAVGALTANLTHALLELEKEHKESAPVSVLIMNGTEDKLMPFDGGEISFLNKKLGKIKSTRETVEFWVKRTGCNAEGETVDLENTDADDGCAVSLTTHTNKKTGAEVALYTIYNGGHRWPGADPKHAAQYLGNTCRDLNATEVLWEFFKTHPKK